ncbi:MAG: hypothetical protein J0H43_10190 [Actinobacteria bacterium]|nr:hypothetical protein [Actinomycetota bacterium]
MSGPSRRAFLTHAGALAGVATATGTAITLLAAAPADATVTHDSLQGFIHDEGGAVYDITGTAYGAKGDTQRSTGSITAGSSTLTAGSGPFLSTDVGKIVTVSGAGASGSVLTAAITAVGSASSVTLSTTAGTTVSGAAFAYGTDDTLAIVAAITAAGYTGKLFAPAGTYLVRASSNGGNPLTLTSSGGLCGLGGAIAPGQSSGNTVFLCADAGAGLVATGPAPYQGFGVDGNGVATTPLAVNSGTHAFFLDVWVTNSSQSGWSITGVAHCGFYDCGAVGNALDGVYIDGGANDLEFVHLYEESSARYGVHGDTSLGGTTQLVHFHGGQLDTPSGGGVQGTSKVYLRGAAGWTFVDVRIVGTNLTGPTVDLDQSAGFGLLFQTCWIWSTSGGGSPGHAGIQVGGTPPGGVARTFVNTDGCHFVAGDTSVYIVTSGSYLYTAAEWVADGTSNGPVAGSGAAAIDTLLGGRTGAWQTATLASPWTGTVTYRTNADGRVQLRGSASGGSSGATILTLPTGYRPAASLTVQVALAAAMGTVTVTSGGVVSATSGSAPGTVHFDNIVFPVN